MRTTRFAGRIRAAALMVTAVGAGLALGNRRRRRRQQGLHDLAWHRRSQASTPIARQPLVAASDPLPAGAPTAPSLPDPPKVRPAPAIAAAGNGADGLAPGPSTEVRLAEVLAAVMDVEAVSATADLFDELGADSMVMAHFCARLRKQDDLPSLSIKEVYQHRTIHSLAAALTEGSNGTDPDDHYTSPDAELTPGTRSNGASAPAPGPMDEAPGPAPFATEPAEPVGTGTYLLCGTLQLLTLIGFAALLIVVAAWGYTWITDAVGLGSTYLRMVVFGAGLFVGLSLLPVVAKWLLIGRWRPGQFRVWSPRYFAFWFVRFTLAASPLVVFAGSPIHLLYLRALGARVGRGAVFLSPRIPVCADLLTVGEGAVVLESSIIQCYRAHAGWIQTGPVTIGRNAVLGEAAVLDIHTSVGDHAQLGHASSLHAGQSVPDGEHRVGSPARQITEVDYAAVPPATRPGPRRVIYSLVQVVLLAGVSLPLAIAIPILIVEPLSDSALRDTGEWPFADVVFYGEAMLVSMVVYAAFVVLGILFVGTFPRLLDRAIEPGRVYPLYGFHYWIHRAIRRLTNVPFHTNMFGDTSYILHYLRWLGYDVSLDEQTGANFGLNVRHHTPYHVTVGPGTMAADGLTLVNTDYSNTSFRVSPVTIGAHSFLGNGIYYPARGKTGENCLHATKVMVPLEGDTRENVGFLGSPSFEIPRTVLRDTRFDELKSADEMPRRLKAKNRHNRATIAMFLASRWVTLFGVVALVWSAVVLHERVGLGPVIPTAVAPFVGFAYLIAVERASTGFKPLQPTYCSMYELASWRVERFWKLSWQPAIFNGTPFKTLAWRLQGVRMGRRVFDDGCIIIDKTLAEVGDHCTLNAGSAIQPHSQEDGTFKSDHVVVGAGCTLGVGALVHYGVTMGDGASLAADSFLMKGADVAPHTHWGDNPAREISADDRARPAPIDLTTARDGHGNGSEPVDRELEVTR